MSVSFDPKFIKFAKTANSTLLNGLMGYWPLDESTGTNFNDEVGTNDGTLGSGTVGATGKITNGVTFNGSSNYVYLPYSGISPSGTEHTIAFWVYMTSTASTLGHNVYLFSYRHASDLSSRVVITSSDNLLYGVWMNSTDTEYYCPSSSAILTTGSWHLVVSICTGTTNPLALFVDNSNVSSSPDTFSGTLKASGDITIVGNSDVADSNAPAGTMCELAYWNRALTSQELTELWNSGNGKTHPFS